MELTKIKWLDDDDDDRSKNNSNLRPGYYVNQKVKLKLKKYMEGRCCNENIVVWKIYSKIKRK